MDLTVALIEKDNINKGAESITEAILQKWLTNDAYLYISTLDRVSQTV